jgi:peptidoglycan/xylan/chitin deacetylase (PgdA/CDA1 family)
MKPPPKIPSIVRWLYPSLTWRIPNEAKQVFLTFDDGPTPEVTQQVLTMLAAYNAKATFFLIGNNAAAYPELMQSLLQNGHRIGNHTYNHENGWHTKLQPYVQSVAETAKVVPSKIFRPPYGRISRSQIRALKNDYHIIMWDVISGDYDTSYTPEECIKNVLNNVSSGSIIVFHDSVKAWPNLKVCLPYVLEVLTARGYSFEVIP